MAVNKTKPITYLSDMIVTCNVNSPAVGDFLFSPVAVDVVHPDPLETVSELRAVGRADDTREAELLADDLGLDGIPLVVADRTPLALVVDLHVSLLKQDQIFSFDLIPKISLVSPHTAFCHRPI